MDNSDANLKFCLVGWLTLEMVWSDFLLKKLYHKFWWFSGSLEQNILRTAFSKKTKFYWSKISKNIPNWEIHIKNVKKNIKWRREKAQFPSWYNMDGKNITQFLLLIISYYYKIKKGKPFLNFILEKTAPLKKDFL